MAKVKPIVFVPDEPIVTGEGESEKTYKELTFKRKMKGRDLLAMDAVSGEMRKSFALFASMADVPIAVFDEMDVDDFALCASEVAPLMGKRGKKMLDAVDQEVETPAGV